jgi:hypothetical protein
MAPDPDEEIKEGFPEKDIPGLKPKETQESQASNEKEARGGGSYH